MTKYTKGPWKVVGNFIISDADNAPEGCSKSDLEAYGGYLIAESIFHPPNRTLIAAALDMLNELKSYLEIFESGTYAVPIDIKHLKTLINKAEEVQ